MWLAYECKLQKQYIFSHSYGMLVMKNHYKIRFILFGTVFGTVIAIIIEVLVAVFSSKIGACVILPIIAFGYWFLDFLDFLYNSSEINPLILIPLFFIPSILYCAGLGFISGILAFKLWTYKERWMAQKCFEYVPQSKLNKWELISFLGITLLIVFCTTYYTMFFINRNLSTDLLVNFH